MIGRLTSFGAARAWKMSAGGRPEWVRASTTGAVQRNQQLARQRPQPRRGFRDLAGSAAQITIGAHGQLGARTAESIENPNERKVEITVEYTVYGTN